MQVLWVLLNCTLSEQEHEARIAAEHLVGSKHTLAGTTTTTSTEVEDEQQEQYRHTVATSTLLSLAVSSDLDIDTTYFHPMIDYLSYYTQFHHPGLRFIIWKLFPDIDNASTIEWRLIRHCPERIRELYLESVQMQDMLPLIVTRLETLHRIKACHESWDVPGSIEFMKRHNQLFGTVRMLELEAYLPDNHDTPMDDNLGDLAAQVDRLKVLELAGFESLQARLELIPRRNLKVLKLNCGKLTPTPSLSDTNTGDHGSDERMTVSMFLSQCRQLEELLLEPVDENVLEWAVQERRDFEVARASATTWMDMMAIGLLSSSPASPTALAHEPRPSLVPLRILELSGTDSEHVAMTISQAAEAFQDTLEVIKANSYSFNRTLNNISWRCPMPRLRVFKIVGRSNLPFDFRSLQYCPALRVLDLSKYSGMRGCSEASLLNLKYLTQLEYLGLSSFDHLTDSTLRTVLGSMPRLKHLRLAIGDSSVASSTLAPSTMTTAATASSIGSGSARGSGILGSGVGGSTGPGGGGLAGFSGRSSSNSNGSGSGGGMTTDASIRSPFAALSLSPTSTSSPLFSSSSSSPVPLSTNQYPLGGTTTYIVTGQIQNQFSQSNNHSNSSNSSYHHHNPSLSQLPPQPPTPGLFSSHSVNSSSTNLIGSEMASSARSTSSLMDRFHLENNYLSLEGILDAIEGLSESKDQLEKLSIVLGKLDFEEHYRRLELYNMQHPELEITVYRYAHTV
ncbi:hypothetical protein BGZ98_001093 [Dissophora globulifera]|nr:hypothetical protein BGZ98_001093 [Dissophora globulifera]